MNSYLTLAWVITVCFLLFFSFIGWGWLLFLLLGKKADDDFGSIAGFGMAALCILGGFLNFFKLISPALMIGLFAIGLIASMLYFKESGRQIRKIVSACWRRSGILMAVFFALLLFMMLKGSVKPLNSQDDLQSYFIFSNQMLQTGHMGAQPFNGGRLGVLGGQEFLNAMFLTLAPYQCVGAVDAVVGWLVFISLVFFHGLRRRLSYVAIFLVLIILHCHVPPSANISSLLTSSALFYLFWRRFMRDGLHGDRKEIIFTAVLIAALCSLKTTNIIGLAFFGGVLFFLSGRTRSLVSFRQAGVSAAIAICLLLPWMIAMYQSSGTLLFPFFGQGFRIGFQQGGASPLIQIDALCVKYFFYILIIIFSRALFFSGAFLLCLLVYRNNLSQDMNPRAVWGFLGALAGTFVLTAVSLGVVRYSYAFAFAAFIILIIESLANMPDSTAKSKKLKRYYFRIIAVWMALILFTIMVLSNNFSPFREGFESLKGFSSRQIGSHHEVDKSLQLAQRMVPAGKAILVNIRHPYKMDFKRNDVYVVDHAGTSGPNGGLPIWGSVTDLAHYLREQNIFYIIYSYSDRHDPSELSRLGGNPLQDTFWRLVKNDLLFQDQLFAFMESFRLIYKDDYCVVIRLED